MVKSALLTSLPTSRPLVSPSCHSRCGSTLKPQSPGDSHSLPRQRSQKLEVPISPTTLISPSRFHIPLASTLVPLVSSQAPYYPHHNQESHASRPRIPHCTPWSSFLQLPDKSSTQCSPNTAALLPHDQDMPTGLLCWTCQQTPQACFCLSAFVHCFLSQEYSLQEFWEEWEFLKSLVTQSHCTPFLWRYSFSLCPSCCLLMSTLSISHLWAIHQHMTTFVCYTFSNFRNNPQHAAGLNG